MPKTGETATTSGIYQVVHDLNHKAPHQITMVQGHRFPPCAGCKSGPTYTLVKKTEHLK